LIECQKAKCLPPTDIYCKKGKELLTRNPRSNLFSSINAIYEEPFSGRFGQRVLAKTSLVRESKCINVVYSPGHLQQILAATKIPSNKDEKALYPIFVTSRLRFRHDPTNIPQDQVPNFLMGRFAPAKVLLIAVVPELQLETYLALFPDTDLQDRNATICHCPRSQHRHWSQENHCHASRSEVVFKYLLPDQ